MDTTTLASAFYKDGYCVVKDIFPADSVEDIRENAIRNFINVKNIIEESRRDFGIGIKHGFKEIVQRHSNRFEMPYGMEDSIYDFVLANKNLREILTEILQCSDYIVANRSLVVSLPGAEEQAWHSDGPHMSMQEHLPCHCLNVFIPLIPVNSSNGPTEIRPGSHYYSRDLTKLYLLAFMRKQIQAPIAPDLDIGSILMVKCTSSIDYHLTDYDFFFLNQVLVFQYLSCQHFRLNSSIIEYFTEVNQIFLNS